MSALEPENSIRCVDVAMRYKGASQDALAPSNLAVRQGEFFSLLGPSGSGKTTLLRLIAGFERPTGGAVWLSGQDVTHVPANRRDVNTVFQNYALFPHMSVADNVAYPLMVRKTGRSEREARVADVLGKVEMSGFEARLPHELSGGQRQRIALARALIAEPKVLLLDEPLGALDLRLRQQMQLVLVHLQKDVGITFIYVTHDQGEALSMSDRIAVLSEGKILQIDTPEAIYQAPHNRFVASFIGTTNLIEGEVSASGDAFTAADADLLVPIQAGETPGAAAFAVRAEALAITPRGEGGHDAGKVRVPATVTDAMYLGGGTEYRARCGGLELKIVDHVAAGRTVTPGTEVDVLVDPKQGVLLRG